MTKRITLTCEKCGKEFSWLPTSTIKPKLCPNCTYRKLYKVGSNKVAKTPIESKNEPEKRKYNKKTPTQKVEKALDTVWSKLVKLLAGKKCEYCGSTNALNSHHIYTRGKKSVRWSTVNGICLCAKHHIGNDFSPHKTGAPFMKWLNSYKGEEFMLKLEIKANGEGKFHLFEKELMLKELLNEIKLLENEQ